MATTALGVHGLPQPEQSFSAKGGSGKGSDQITALAVYGLPAQIHAFVAKSPATATTEVTALAVYATPGRIHAFVAKTAATPEPEPEPTPTPIASGAGGVFVDSTSDFNLVIEKLRKERVDEESIVVIITLLADDF